MSAAVEQRTSALAKANEVRLARARAKRALRAGTMRVAEALVLPECQGMRVEDVLSAQRWWGEARTEKVMVAAGVGLGQTVGELTARQRDALVGLKPKPPRPPDDRTRSASSNVHDPCPECGLPKYLPGSGSCGLCVEEAEGAG